MKNGVFHNSHESVNVKPDLRPVCVQCFLFLVLKCPHVAKIGTVYKAQSSPSDSRTFIMQPDPERHITKLLIVCEHTHYFKKNSLYAHTHTHCWHLTVSWMSASFSKKLVNIPRNRSCLNCHRLPLQHPYCTCVCLGVCVHACFNSLLSIVPARWDQFYIERSIISSYESFRQFNRISGSFIYKSKCSSSILKPLHKQDTAQEDANAPERQSLIFLRWSPIYFWHFKVHGGLASSWQSKERSVFSWHLLYLREFTSCGEICSHANVKRNLCMETVVVPQSDVWCHWSAFSEALIVPVHF